MVWYYNHLFCKILILFSTVMFRAGREVRAKWLSLYLTHSSALLTGLFVLCYDFRSRFPT